VLHRTVEYGVEEISRDGGDGSYTQGPDEAFEVLRGIEHASKPWPPLSKKLTTESREPGLTKGFNG
jgi:hypothetical protein